MSTLASGIVHFENSHPDFIKNGVVHMGPATFIEYLMQYLRP